MDNAGFDCRACSTARSTPNALAHQSRLACAASTCAAPDIDCSAARHINALQFRLKIVAVSTRADRQLPGAV
jgi:hypothetical protein